MIANGIIDAANAGVAKLGSDNVPLVTILMLLAVRKVVTRLNHFSGSSQEFKRTEFCHQKFIDLYLHCV